MWIKDPDARLDYVWDWSAWLVGADTIDSASFTYTTNDGTLEIGAPAIGAGTVTAFIDGGTLGRTYSVTCHIVTAEGREDDRSQLLKVCQR
jgi:hypothetical protein